MAEAFPSRLAGMLRELKAKESQPASVSILTKWINQAEFQLGGEAGGGRLGWLIASSVAVAVVQQALDSDGRQLFLLKRGNLLQHRLDVPSRPTKDIDGLVRGDIELRGTTWRRLQFEISPDEAGIGEESEFIESMPLAGFGLSDLDGLVGLALRYQIAQKFYAVSDLHNPPEAVNDRPRDVVDLILLRHLVAATGHPTSNELALAAKSVFDARAEDALALDLVPRYWPTNVLAHRHWSDSYLRAATEVGVTLALDEAVAQVNDWIESTPKMPRSNPLTSNQKQHNQHHV